MKLDKAILAQRLDKAIALSGKTPFEISKEADCTWDSIRSWLKGKYYPNRGKLLRLAKVLGVSENWLRGKDK